MNKVHKDGRALLTLSSKVERDRNGEADRKKNAESKPAPPPNIQRQDTDYDVKPEIPPPDPARRKSRNERASHQAHAALPDIGVLTHATQMGESELDESRDAEKSRERMMRSLYL